MKADSRMRRHAIDAAFEMLLDAVRHSPDEVAAAVGNLSAEHGPDRINRVLDSVELRLSVKRGIRCRLPQATRDAARPVWAIRSRLGAIDWTAVGDVVPLLDAFEMSMDSKTARRH